ncbi:MAG: hypothetical protein U9Q68_04420, partial [Euryarchaeota archaeon]|nr:hypothetical protein [Euryarchaeota archaeon]
GVMITQHCETKARYIRITDMHGPRIYTSLAEFEVQVEPNSGLFLTLDYGNKIETIDIGDLVSLTVTDGSVTKLLWAN